VRSEDTVGFGRRGSRRCSWMFPKRGVGFRVPCPVEEGPACRSAGHRHRRRTFRDAEPFTRDPSSRLQARSLGRLPDTAPTGGVALALAHQSHPRTVKVCLLWLLSGAESDASVQIAPELPTVQYFDQNARRGSTSSSLWRPGSRRSSVGRWWRHVPSGHSAASPDISPTAPTAPSSRLPRLWPPSRPS